MRNVAKIGYVLLGGWWVSLSAMAQSPCPGDSLALNVTVDTDDWGYEAYWELLPAEGDCGDGTALLWGGNSEVGCSADFPGLESETLPSNVQVTSATVCVSEGDSLILFHRDSFGDGGTSFSIALQGEEVLSFQGAGGGNEWGMSVAPAASYASFVPCLADTIVANGPSWVGSNEAAYALPAEVAPPALGCGTYGGWCEGGVAHSLWLRWIVPSEGGVFEVSTCNDSTTFDTQLAMWQASDCSDWSTYTLLNASDDHGCDVGSFRSTFLTPCLEGGEEFLFQIDGYLQEVGQVEVSVGSVDVSEAFSASASVSGLSCNLSEGFNPDGSIVLNVNAGPNSAEWTWEGAFGSVYTGSQLSNLLPGIYTASAAFCGTEWQETFEVDEPAMIDLTVSLSPDCEDGSMAGFVSVGEEEDFASVTWQVGGQVYNGGSVEGLVPGLCEVFAVTELGCEASTYAWVESVGIPELDLGPDVFGCTGEVFTFLAPIDAGLQYNWSTGDDSPLLNLVGEGGTTVIALQVTDNAGCEATDVVLVTVEDCTSDIQGAISSLGTWEKVSAFPNPFRSSLVLNAEGPLRGERIRVLDAMGRLVPCQWRQESQGWQLDTELAPGMYTLVSPDLQGSLRVVAE